MYLLRALVVWLVLIGVEVVHGVLRGLLLVPRVGDLRARQIGVLIGSALIFGVACLFVRWIGATSRRQLAIVGVAWLALTFLFEVGLGRAMGFSWDRILEDYDVSRGGFMAFGLLFLAASPLFASRVRARGRSRT